MEFAVGLIGFCFACHCIRIMAVLINSEQTHDRFVEEIDRALTVIAVLVIAVLSLTMIGSLVWLVCQHVWK
jgi:hypothetical protein